MDELGWLREVLDATPDFVGIADAATRRPLYLNRAGRRMLGLAEHGDLDWTLDQAHPSEVNERLQREAFPAAVRDGYWSGDGAFRSRAGRVIPVSMVILAHRKPSGEVVRFSTISRDLTSRLAMEAAQKATEKALRESEELFRQLAETIREVFWLADPDMNRIFYVSPAYEEIWGRTCRSLYENPWSWADAIVPEDRSRVVAAALEQGPGGEYDETYRIVRPDGEVRWIRDRAFPVRDREGRVIRLAGVAQDVTDLRAAEEERDHARRRLVESQKMEAIGRLAGGVAHDFNNLLTAIRGYADLAWKALRAGDPLRDDIEEIRKASTSAAEITRHLLAFSRRQPLDPRPCHLAEVVRGMQRMLGRLLGEDVEIRAELPADLPLVRADPVQLEQVILNLAVNARDAMPGGGRLSLTAGPVTLDEAAAARLAEARPGRYVELAVSDTGQGMAPEVRSRIFEPFFTTKEQGKGTGLGLAVVYGVVRQSRGYVTVESEVGRGSTFRVAFPVATDAAEPVRPAERVTEPAGTETLLLVEDQELVRRFAQRVLEAQGYRVIVAASAGEALLASEREPGRIQLLVTDLVMPQMGGAELAHRLAPGRPDMQVLFVSGYADGSISSMALPVAGRPFLAKPYAPEALARKVRDVLDGKDGQPGGRE